MSKKYILSAAALVAALSLTACGDKKEETKNTKETATSETVETQMPKVNDEEKSKEEATVFTGVLAEDAREAGTSTVLTIVETEGVKDKNDIVKMFSQAGVVINLDDDQLGKDLTAADYKAGQKVEVEIEGSAPMTRSLPPQLPGSAVISIKKI